MSMRNVLYGFLFTAAATIGCAPAPHENHSVDRSNVIREVPSLGTESLQRDGDVNVESHTIDPIVPLNTPDHPEENAADSLGPTEPTPDNHPELTRLSPVDDVWIDPKKKILIVGGSVVLDRGPIEFFACPRNTKEHESIVAVRCSARLVHAGLLALGLMPGSPVSFDPAYVAARGPRVLVEVKWTNSDGILQQVPAQQWIRDTRFKTAMKEHWVFAGSGFWTDQSDGKEYYQADGGDLICVSNFPTATLDLPIASSQANEALLFEAFEGIVPKRGTDMELIFSARDSEQ